MHCAVFLVLISLWIHSSEPFGTNCNNYYGEGEFTSLPGSPLLHGSLLNSFNMPPNLTVVFLGDQGLKDHSKEVLQMVKGWSPDFILHSGDFGALQVGCIQNP